MCINTCTYSKCVYICSSPCGGNEKTARLHNERWNNEDPFVDLSRSEQEDDETTIEIE